MLIVAALTTPGKIDAAVERPNCKRYVDLARQIGWPKSERANLARIMWRESRCSAAFNPNDPWGGSYGLLQINGSNVGWATRMGYIKTRNDLFDHRKNLKVGLELWKLYGWKPWGTKASEANPTK